MDEFKYVLLMEKIDKSTTLISKERIMRELIALPDQLFTEWGSIYNTKITYDNLRAYKCYCKVFNLYTGKNLPKFFESIYTNTSTQLFHKIAQEKSYSYFNFAFEFTPVVATQHMNASKLLNQIAPVIESKPIDFNIEYQIYPNSGYGYVFTDSANQALLEYDSSIILEVEALKKLQYYDKPYTIVEDILSQWYKVPNNGLMHKNKLKKIVNTWSDAFDIMAEKISKIKTQG